MKFTAFFLGLALAAPAFGGTPAGTAAAAATTSTPMTVTELVSAVEKTYSAATSIRAEFLQVNENKALGNSTQQRGRISLERPRKVRIEMGTPMTQALVSDGTTMWSYDVKSKQVFETPDKGQGSGMGILLEDLSKISELFEVTILPEDPAKKQSITVKLVPKKAGGLFKSLQLTLAKGKYTLEKLVLVDQLDAVTEMTFSMVKMNVDIPDAEFKLVVPPGVQVIKG